MVIKILSQYEANAVLPLVKEHFLEIHMLMNELEQLMAKTKSQSEFLKFDAKNPLLKLKEVSKRSAKSREQKIVKLKAQINQNLRTIYQLGGIVRELFPPHIDFASYRKGNLVYLCWHGEDEIIDHWHHPQDHSSVRQKISSASGSSAILVH